MNSIIYALLAAIVVGLYLRDSGLLTRAEAKESTVNSVSKPSEDQIPSAIVPNVQEKVISIPTDHTGNSLRILFCTS